jgi:phosphoglycerate dehydrogenase-like enzyme
LNEGWIRGAGLDVFEQEPVQNDNPLLKMDNVVLTPHALAQTDQTFSYMWEIITGQMAAILRGETPYAVVNKEVLDSEKLKAKLKRLQAETR